MNKRVLLSQAADAWELVRPAVDSGIKNDMFKRGHLHIVVLYPTRPYGSGFSFEEAILFETSLGDEKEWKNPYKELARSKARVSWRTGLHSHIVLERRPYMLHPADTHYYGSVFYEGIVVACSGVEQYFDQMIALWVASTFQALAIRAMQEEAL